jgi:hypothetical protein
MAKPKNYRTEAKCFRIRTIEVTEYVSKLPHGRLSELVNELLEEHVKKENGGNKNETN